MTTAVPNFIKVFYKFLDSDLVKIEDLKDIGDILKLPIYSFKFLDKKQAKILEDLLEIFDIQDASKLNKENPFESLIQLKSTDDPIKATLTREKLKKKIEELKEKFPNLEDKLKKSITISSIISDIKDESKELEKDKQKVIVIGLDNAGKTALLTKFGGGLGIGELASLQPTRGVKRQYVEGENLDLFIWDFGGQEQYRNEYFSAPEKYFLQINLLIYVIDVQDTDRFEESLEYFDKILNILITLEESPYVLIFIHKHDPDIKKDSTVMLSVELLTDSIEDLFKDKKFDYEIYLTSIFSLISNEPTFSKHIKDVMKSKNALTDPTVKKLDGFAKILEENMNLVIRLSESLSLQLNEIDNRLRAIESGAFYLAEAGIPVELKTPMQIQDSKEVREGNVRSQVLNELKDLFAKKKSLE